MTSDVGQLAQFSQECLYFPLSLADVTIENIVQLRNLLQRTEDRAENIIAFKVLCSVRNRYSVLPSTGFIFPGESAKVKFFFDPQKIRRYHVKKKGTASKVVLPDASTKDEMFVDIAVVTKDQAKVYLINQSDKSSDHGVGSSGAETYFKGAAAFWKARGLVKPGEANTERRKLRCVYGEKGVPDSLVMRMSKEGSVSTQGLEIARLLGPAHVLSLPLPKVPSSRPQTANTNPNRKLPPLAPPRVSNGHSRRSFCSDSLPTCPSRQSSAFSLTPTHQRNNSDFSMDPPLAAVPNVDEVAKDERSFWEKYFCYKIPFSVLWVLLLASFLCALFETETFLSWLLIGQ